MCGAPREPEGDREHRHHHGQHYRKGAEQDVTLRKRNGTLGIEDRGSSVSAQPLASRAEPIVDTGR